MTETIPFQTKLKPEHKKKLQVESERLWLNMSQFISMLIETYDHTKIFFNSN